MILPLGERLLKIIGIQWIEVFHHNNARPRMAGSFLAFLIKKKIEIFPPPACSLDLAPYNFWVSAVEGRVTGTTLRHNSGMHNHCANVLQFVEFWWFWKDVHQVARLYALLFSSSGCLFWKRWSKLLIWLIIPHKNFRFFEFWELF